MAETPGSNSVFGRARLGDLRSQNSSTYAYRAAALWLWRLQGLFRRRRSIFERYSECVVKFQALAEVGEVESCSATWYLIG